MMTERAGVQKAGGSADYFRDATRSEDAWKLGCRQLGAQTLTSMGPGVVQDSRNSQKTNRQVRCSTAELVCNRLFNVRCDTLFSRSKLRRLTTRTPQFATETHRSKKPVFDQASVNVHSRKYSARRLICYSRRVERL